MMLQQYLKELQEEDVSSEEFVERLASRTVINDDPSDFDWELMHDTFLRAVSDLELLKANQRKKCHQLEEEISREEKNCYQDLALLQERNTAAFSTFEELDQKINYVVTKVVHVGNRLENINALRTTATQAQKLLQHLNQFMDPEAVVFGELSNINELFEAADLIQKLYTISQELPSSKFEVACKKIYQKYNDIEKSLIEEFVLAYSDNDVGRMKELASTLSHFKGYSQCVDAFIEQSQSVPQISEDVFLEIPQVAEKNYHLAKQIFNNPEQVMSKVVLNMYHLKLQQYVQYTLSSQTDKGKYLVTLMDLYSKTEELSKKLSKLNMGLEDSFLSQLSRAIFQKYLETYIADEKKHLGNKCEFLFQQFYESKGHQKKPSPSGLKRELQAVIGNKKEEVAGETYLSQKIVNVILEDAKNSLQRVELLSKPTEVASHVSEIFELVFVSLINDFVGYAIDLGLRSIPQSESKHLPLRRFYFFDIIKQTNEIVHVVESFFTESVLPLIGSTPKCGECILLKRNLFSVTERKLQVGLERVIDALVLRSKMFLQSEQRKTDFKTDKDVDIATTPPCTAVTQCLSVNIDHMKESLDGRNLEIAASELGSRFHSVIYDHLQQFQYDYLGAMCAICDVDNYRKCFQRFNSPSINLLFDTLHAACNLLIVKPENLNQVCAGEQLNFLDRSVILSFICLREDYKTKKLNREL